jgi:peptide/nickel transport system substrate-binding protein
LFTFYNATEGFYSGADTAETTKLTEQATTNVSAAKRDEIWQQMQEIIEKEQYLLPVTYSPFIWALNEDVSGFTVPLTGLLWLADTGFSG